MSKLQINILSILLLPVIGILGYIFVNGVMEPVEKQKEATRIEDKKIEKLKKIREVQEAYYNEKGKYAGKWKKLHNWVLNGQITITEKKEKMLNRNEIEIQIDTIKSVPAKDSLFPKDQYPEYNMDVLAGIPESDKRFILYSKEIEKGNIQEAKVNVLEVKDREPVSKYSKRKKIIGEPLKIGSRTKVTLNGNWQY